MSYYVYMMASHRRVLYVGVCRNLDKRVWEHQHDTDPASFTARYRVHKLVYFEQYSRIVTAITREKELKGWTRAKKVTLIESVNPKWRDLSGKWGRRAQILRPGEAKPQNDNIVGIGFIVERRGGYNLLRLSSKDGTNRLTRGCVVSLINVVQVLAKEQPQPLIITGNQKFFSAGADLNEIVPLSGPGALEFARMGQAMTAAVDNFPALVIAAINGYCMGGGLDLALACDLRIASPHAIFGHRGAALGLMTGWGGTQRLSRLVGKARALEMFAAAEKLDAAQALRVGLVDGIVEDAVAEAAQRVEDLLAHPPTTAQS